MSGKFRKENDLKVYQNSFLISASQKIQNRLSLERAVHAEENSEKRSYGPAEQTGTTRRAEGWRSHRQLAALSSASTGNRRKAPAVYPHSATVGRVQMTNHLLAGVAAVVLMSGVSSAQTYPPAPPPPVAPPPIPGAPPAPLPGPSTSTTTTVAPTPDGGYRSSTTQTGVDEYGSPVTKKDIYKQGVTGSSETHSKTETDPTGAGTTTQSTTTTTPR
jgi:hypothetical protein